MDDPWSQHGYRCRLEWGRRGARVAAERGDVLVVVDVLSFSTAAVTAVQHGGGGREPRAAGFPEDVEHASRLNAYQAVPAMQNDELSVVSHKFSGVGRDVPRQTEPMTDD